MVIREKAAAAEGKDSVRATRSTIGKGNQELRDIPQSVTVVTEKLIDDRNLDTAPATATMLPRIAEALAGDLPLLVDGGIRRGTDVLKAIALGARAVLVGRPYVYGLANAGALGVAHVLRLLRDELEIAMALCGCATLDRATPELLFRVNRP